MKDKFPQCEKCYWFNVGTCKPESLMEYLDGDECDSYVKNIYI